MGHLLDGRWIEGDTQSRDGHFVREPATRRHWITADGSPGPDGHGGFAAEAGRYHLYASLACPWAHRTLIVRRLKGLELLVGVSLVGWLMGAEGWRFDHEHGSSGDALDGLEFLRQRYLADDPHYSGRVSVPLLWDRRLGRIVSNESADIMRMLNRAFDGLTGSTLDLCPPPLQGEIDALNARIYPAINDGVYRAGFATSQTAYEEAFEALFHELDWLERRLGGQRYLAGAYLTEADWRLFTSLVRFDAVYHGHFKCNLRRLRDYPNLSGWLRELYQWPGIAETVNLAHIKGHYYASQRQLNPSGIVPLGPEFDFDHPHQRQQLAGKGHWQRTTASVD